ncbi:MAG: sigma-70 family RNA polymerase sigma factor [Verrucomicrobiales bacterium]|nr:sigma-70 family RNA polymerase sigma factor [Verrucomicrobiales bacterium]
MSENPTDSNFHEPFVRALTKYERIVRAYIRGSGILRPEDVDEIMQEVSLVAWKKFDQLENIEEFPRWACVIARYQILTFRRSHARDRLVLNEKVFDLLLEESLGETETNEKRLTLLQQCLNKLPEASRQLVLAAYEPGSTIDQLATEAGKKANNLYQQLWRLRRSLEQCVEEKLNKEQSPELS